MNQAERRAYLIRALLAEQPGRYAGMTVPADMAGQRRLLRGLMNVRPPLSAPPEFLQAQDAYLQEELARKGITDADAIEELQEGVCLWRGDITTLKCDAIVNAANSALLGCFCPNHGCIDNAIHTYAGIQLRSACEEIMERQGHEEPTGGCKITPAFNLPSRYVLHTVGPIVREHVTAQDREDLASCYRACLDLADREGLRSVAFCCISTGEFRFPNEQAARIAVKTVCEHEAVRQKRIRVIFNVFKEQDEAVYRRILTADREA
ncbi:MAG: protein-ADP-ribose hydrolase [Clostridia bacterium]|nr:protein-ADP-ribose hydrolase [Clostridia bacterium]